MTTKTTMTASGDILVSFRETLSLPYSFVNGRSSSPDFLAS